MCFYSYVFLLPDIILHCCLGNNHGLWQGASLYTRLLKKVGKTGNISARQTCSRRSAFSLSLLPPLTLTMAASASWASLMKGLRTLRSQMGLRGDGRLGRVHSNTINRKASNPVIPETKTNTHMHINGLFSGFVFGSRARLSAFTRSFLRRWHT